jgi:Xaa-Pro dipeptidase
MSDLQRTGASGEWPRRIEALRAGVEPLGADGVIVSSVTNLRYYTGLAVHPYERLFALVVPLRGAPLLVAPRLEQDAVAANAAGVEAIPWDDEDGPYGALVGALGRAGMTAPALEKRTLTVEVFEALQRRLSRPGFADASPALEAVRERKSAGEIDAVRRAARVVDACLERLPAIVEEGMTERALRDALDAMAAMLGSEAPAFDSIVLAGPNTALPHGMPGERRLMAGDLLTVDFGATVDGYRSDITRAFSLGPPGARAAEIHAVVVAALAAGIAAAQPGVPCGDVDRAARSVVEDAGYGAQFVHRTGHGLGLEAHESPSLVAGSRRPLAEGAVVTVEPGIYLPGVAGVRVEDDLHVTAAGGEVLTAAPRDLVVLGA